MPLLKDGRFVEDQWQRLEEHEIVPRDGAVIVDLERWQVERETLKERTAPLGLLLLPGQSPEEVAEDLPRFDLIALSFPAFKDGRAYSYARILRERLGYKGELRAVGEVLQDQLFFMVRVGFDAFEVNTRTSEEDFAAEMAKFPAVYQPSSCGETTVFARRHVGLAQCAAE
ncbi:MAG: DUF934 domain-containing protein [Alphaproteobacteria bacterium]|nr:MAG: DUF934 domain-containing protein [Alphaproteobacteria bacterium]